MSLRSNPVTPKGGPGPTSNHPHSPLPQHLATTPLLSVSVDLPVLDISHKWAHTTRGLSCLAPLTQHAVLGVCPHYSVCRSSIPYGQVLFHCVDHVWLLSLSMLFLGFVHIIRCVGAPSLWPGATPLCRYIALHPFVPVASLIVQMVQNLPAVKETRV